MTGIRPAGPADIDPVCALLHTHMNPRIPRDRWRHIMTYPWLAEKPDLGWLVERDGAVVGYLGLIYADRDVSGGRTARVATLTSMYLDKSLRGAGVGNELVNLALNDPAVTYTAISSTRKTHAMLASRGFQILDDHRYVWRVTGPRVTGPRVTGQSTSGVRILTDPAAIHATASPAQRILLADHAPHRVTPVWLDTADGACLLMLAVREKSADVRYYEALHVSSPHVLARHAQQVTDLLLPAPPHPAVLAVDCRFLAGTEVNAATEPLPVPRSYRTPGVEACYVDFLYSEIPLLDLKLD